MGYCSGVGSCMGDPSRHRWDVGHGESSKADAAQLDANSSSASASSTFLTAIASFCKASFARRSALLVPHAQCLRSLHVGCSQGHGEAPPT